jgi:hypothetical protein
LRVTLFLLGTLDALALGMDQREGNRLMPKNYSGTHANGTTRVRPVLLERLKIHNRLVHGLPFGQIDACSDKQVSVTRSLSFDWSLLDGTLRWRAASASLDKPDH